METVFLGLDIGNLNVDGVALRGQTTALLSYGATTGGTPENTENDTGHVTRLVLNQPRQCSIGYTAVKESPTGRVHDTSKQRYYGAARDGDNIRPLSDYYASLADWGIGKAIADTSDGSEKETVPVILTVTIPQNHYSLRLEKDLSVGLSGERTIGIEGQPPVKVNVTTYVKTQPYCAMVSQYGRVKDGSVEVRDSSWFESVCGVIDDGSETFHVARFEPQPNGEGEKVISCMKHNCTEGGMWSLVPRLEQLINNHPAGEILSLDAQQVMGVLETGGFNGVDFGVQRQQVIDEKTPELIADTRSVFGNAEDLKKIVLVGRGMNGISQVFVDAFSTTAKHTGLQIAISRDDNGNLNPGTAIADGAFKYSLLKGEV